MPRVFAILMVLISQQAFAYECGERPFTSMTVNGVNVGIFAKVEDFEGSPEWKIDEGDPPLSISSAVTLVKKWSVVFYPRFDSVNISSFKMVGSACWTLKNQWVYVFTLTPVIDGNELHGAYIVAVTMNGTILEPREY